MRIESLMKFVAVFGCAVIVTGCGLLGEQKNAGTPEPPKNVKVTMKDDGVVLSWDCIPDARKYTVFWGNESRSYRGIIDCKPCSIYIDGLKPGGVYSFAVTAWNVLGESDYSTEHMIVFDRDPAKAETYLAKGTRLMESGELDRAQAYISAAMRLAPEEPKPSETVKEIRKQLDDENLDEIGLARARELVKRALSQYDG